jgi:hypothetical protein
MRFCSLSLHPIGAPSGTPLEHLFATEERLTLGLVVVDLGDDDEVPVDELIINSSLALFHPEDGPKPPAFRDVVSFIEKVMHLNPLNVL